MIFWRRPAAPAVPQIRPEEVERLLEAGERLMIVDVRDPHEFAAGHIPGAQLIPLSQVQGRAGELDRAAEIVVVCRSGRRSDLACQVLLRMGFPGVKNMVGGMLAWRGPVERGLP